MFNMQEMLSKAAKALPVKHPLRGEIETGLAKRAEFTARAKKAWETMRAAKKPPVAKPAPKAAPVKAKAKAK
jgi:hypothetical protein